MFGVAAAMLWVYILQCKRDQNGRVQHFCTVCAFVTHSLKSYLLTIISTISMVVTLERHVVRIESTVVT